MILAPELTTASLPISVSRGSARPRVFDADGHAWVTDADGDLSCSRYQTRAVPGTGTNHGSLCRPGLNGAATASSFSTLDSHAWIVDR